MSRVVPRALLGKRVASHGRQSRQLGRARTARVLDRSAPVNLVERPLPPRSLRALLSCLAIATPVAAVAATDPIASSSFTGVENPLFENGAWQSMFSMAPEHTQFQKNNAAFMDRFDGTHNNHAVARTTAAIPTDHYSEIVVG